MKYKTWEAIAMLEKNPELKFSSLDKTGVLSVNYLGYLLYDGKVTSKSISRNIKPTEEWELVQEPVPFMEAVKAYSEGKTIRCEQDNGMINRFVGGTKYSQFRDENGCSPCYDRIINSKWYIGHE